MVIQTVMDRTGYSRHSFDQNDAQELAKGPAPPSLTPGAQAAVLYGGPGIGRPVRPSAEGAERQSH